MSALSFRRANLLRAFDAAGDGCLTAFDAHRNAFADYSTGTKWMAKKFDTLVRMERAGLVVGIGQTGKGETIWQVTPAGRQAVAQSEGGQ